MVKKSLSLLLLNSASVTLASPIAATEAQITEALNVAANQINASAPSKKNDGGAMLIKAIAGPGRAFAYMYVDPTPVAEWSQERRSFTKKRLHDTYCDAKQMQFFRDYGILVRYVTNDKEGNQVFNYTFTPNDCKH